MEIFFLKLSTMNLNTQLFDKKCIKSDNVITISNNSNKIKRKISCFYMQLMEKIDLWFILNDNYSAAWRISFIFILFLDFYCIFFIGLFLRLTIYFYQNQKKKKSLEIFVFIRIKHFHINPKIEWDEYSSNKSHWF